MKFQAIKSIVNDQVNNYPEERADEVNKRTINALEFESGRNFMSGKTVEEM